ncbi:MAG: hypothetical protein ACRDI0_03225 [Actinomycetota bacterium]
MRSDTGEAWERTPRELLSPREPVPPARWARVVAGVAGGLVGAVVASSLTLVDDPFLGVTPQVVVIAPVGAMVGAPLAVAITLDLQRWRHRRRADRATGR